MSSSKAHPVLAEVLRLMYEHAKYGVDFKRDKHFVHFYTGPGECVLSVFGGGGAGEWAPSWVRDLRGGQPVWQPVDEVSHSA